MLAAGRPPAFVLLPPPLLPGPEPVELDRVNFAGQNFPLWWWRCLAHAELPGTGRPRSMGSWSVTWATGTLYEWLCESPEQVNSIFSLQGVFQCLIMSENLQEAQQSTLQSTFPSACPCPAAQISSYVQKCYLEGVGSCVKANADCEVLGFCTGWALHSFHPMLLLKSCFTCWGLFQREEVGAARLDGGKESCWGWSHSLVH